MLQIQGQAQTQYKNASIVFITPINRILLVRLIKNGKWTTPGGLIDRTDSSPWYAAMREFYEEVGTRLDESKITNIIQYIYNIHTINYIIHSTQQITHFRPNNEINKIHFYRIDKLKQIVYGIDRSFELPSYAMGSFLQMFNNNLIQSNQTNQPNQQFNQPNQQFNQPNQLNQQFNQPNQQFNQPNQLNQQFNQPNQINQQFNQPNQQLNSNKYSLVYLGVGPDNNIPWGGYHITIIGRNNIPVNNMYNLVKNNCTMFDKYNGQYGWIMHDKNRTIRVKSTRHNSYKANIKSRVINEFANRLGQLGLTNIKSNWHILLNTNDYNSANNLINYWINHRIVFGIYVVEYDNITKQVIWYRV